MKKQLKDKKIQILVSTTTAIPGKTPKKTWALMHTGTLWAYVRQLSQLEYFSAKAASLKEEMLFVINWRNDIDPLKTCIKYKDKYYYVSRVDTYEGYKQDLKLFAAGGSVNPPD